MDEGATATGEAQTTPSRRRSDRARRPRRLGARASTRRNPPRRRPRRFRAPRGRRPTRANGLAADHGSDSRARRCRAPPRGSDVPAPERAAAGVSAGDWLTGGARTGTTVGPGVPLGGKDAGAPRPAARIRATRAARSTEPGGPNGAIAAASCLTSARRRETSRWRHSAIASSISADADHRRGRVRRAVDDELVDPSRCRRRRARAP